MLMYVYNNTPDQIHAKPFTLMLLGFKHNHTSNFFHLFYTLYFMVFLNIR
jgi:hypothetical protein